MDRLTLGINVRDMRRSIRIREQTRVKDVVDRDKGPKMEMGRTLVAKSVLCESHKIVGGVEEDQMERWDYKVCV